MIDVLAAICVGWLILSIPAAVFVWWRLGGMDDVEYDSHHIDADVPIAGVVPGDGDRAKMGAT